MPKLPNGMIVFMRDGVIPGPKIFDIEVTNSSPLIALSEETYLMSRNGNEVLRGYDHISIPPDFRLHISGSQDHIFFDVKEIWKTVGDPQRKLVHYFTAMGLPAKYATPLIYPGKRRKWGPSVIISPNRDSAFNDATRLSLDFFLHNLPIDAQTILAFPPVIEGSRFVGDNHGPILGPYSYEALQRKSGSRGDLLLTMRYGYVNIEDDQSMRIYSPLRIFQKSPNS